MAAEKKEVEAQPQAAEGSAEEKKKEEEEEVQYEVNDEDCVTYAIGKTKVTGWVVANGGKLVFLQRVDESKKKPLHAFKDVTTNKVEVGDIAHKEESKTCCIVSPESFSFVMTQGENQLTLQCAEEEAAKKLRSMVEKELAACGEVRLDIAEDTGNVEDLMWYQDLIATMEEKPRNYKLLHSDHGFHFYARHIQTKEFPEIRGKFKVHASQKQLEEFYLAKHNLIHLFGGPQSVESVNVLPESRNGAKYGLQVRLRSEWRQPPLFYFSPREFIVSVFVHHNEDSTVIAWSSDKDSYLPTPSGFVRATIVSAGLRITQLDGDDCTGASSVCFSSQLNVDGWLQYAPTVYLHDYLMKTQLGFKAVFETYDELDNAIETEAPVNEGGMRVVFKKEKGDPELAKRLEEADSDPLNEEPWLETEVMPAEGEGEEGGNGEEGEETADEMDKKDKKEKKKKLTKEEKKAQKLAKKQKKAEEKQRRKEEKQRKAEEKKKKKEAGASAEGEATEKASALDNKPKNADVIFFETQL